MPASPGHSLLLIPVSVDIQSCSWDCWDLLGSESSDIETGPHRGSMWMSACLPIFVTAQTCRQIIYITLQCTDHTTSLEDNFFDFKGTTSPAPAAEYNWGLFFTDGAPRQKEEKRKTTEDLWMQWRRMCKDLVWQRRMTGIELDGGRWSVGKTPKGSDWKKNLSEVQNWIHTLNTPVYKCLCAHTRFSLFLCPTLSHAHFVKGISQGAAANTS